MRSLAEIVKANQEAEKLGMKVAVAPVGTKPGSRVILSPERLQKLGLDKY